MPSSSLTFACPVTRVTLQTAALDADVLAFLQAIPLLSLPRDQLLSSGYHLHILREAYYESYVHALASSPFAPVPSLDSNTGEDHAKPAAPLPLIAFLQAVREANGPLFAALATALEAVPHEAATHLAGMVRSGCALADLALQVRFLPTATQGWHIDRSNSLLHMAVSVHGSRTLLLREASQHMEGEKADMTRALRPGSVYLTSPALFRHAVQVESVPDSERVTAIQCRFLGSKQAIELVSACQRDSPEHWLAIAQAFSTALQPQALRMPALADVTRVLTLLASQRGEGAFFHGTPKADFGHPAHTLFVYPTGGVLQHPQWDLEHSPELIGCTDYQRLGCNRNREGQLVTSYMCLGHTPTAVPEEERKFHGTGTPLWGCPAHTLFVYPEGSKLPHPEYDTTHSPELLGCQGYKTLPTIVHNGVTVQPYVCPGHLPLPPVLAHYMPWFRLDPTAGGYNHWSHGKWDLKEITGDGAGKGPHICAHDMPLIGPYDSRNREVVSFHLRLMKEAGIQGVIIDWRGASGTPDAT